MTDLRKAAEDLLNRYVDLVNCGDCGYWNPEEEKEVIALRQALAEPEQEPTSVKHMVSWIDYLKGFSDNGIHMKIQSGLSAGDCYRLAVELEQFINRTHVDAVNTLQKRVDETAKREHEPVAWIRKNGFRFDANLEPQDDSEIPLYTAPPKREWVGLTDEDRQEFAAAQHGWEELCAAVEAKLKEKNT